MDEPTTTHTSVFLGIFVCSQSGESQGLFLRILWCNQGGNHWEENLANLITPGFCFVNLGVGGMAIIHNFPQNKSFVPLALDLFKKNTCK